VIALDGRQHHPGFAGGAGRAGHDHLREGPHESRAAGLPGGAVGSVRCLAAGRWPVAGCVCHRYLSKPAELAITSDGKALELELASFTGARIETLAVTGDVQALAAALRERWNARGSGATLARRFDHVNFYVHHSATRLSFTASSAPPAPRGPSRSSARCSPRWPRPTPMPMTARPLASRPRAGWSNTRSSRPRRADDAQERAAQKEAPRLKLCCDPSRRGRRTAGIDR
jgi:hypothetical protein